MKFASPRLGKDVFDLEDVTLVRGDKVLLDHLTWQLGPGDRVGLVGVNGAGKTSLLRLLCRGARTGGAAGGSTTGRTVSSAHLSQEVDELDPDVRVLHAVERIETRRPRPGRRDDRRVAAASSFGFTKEKQWTAGRRPLRR